MAQDLKCPECGAPMVLRSTSKYQTRDGKEKKFYGCTRYPECKATHGAHPDGKPYGVPGDQETKALRMKAHTALDNLMVRVNFSKNQAYKFIREAMNMNEEQAHIGNFNKEQCEKLITKINELLANY